MSERSRTYRKPKVCVVCGKPLPSHKRFFCSDECHKEADSRAAKNGRKEAQELGMTYDNYISFLKEKNK